MSTPVIKDTAPKISPKAVSVVCVKIVKLMINVLPEAINRQLSALSRLRCGLSFVIFGVVFRLVPMN